MDWGSILSVGHIVGTVLGVGGATFAEIFYLRAIRDGEINAEEGMTLGVSYKVLRIGLILLVLSGFGILLMYRLEGNEERLYNPAFWAKMFIVLVLVFNAIMIQARKMPLWLGSSLSLTSWYAALIIGAWRRPEWEFGEAVEIYLIAVVVVAIALHWIKKAISIKPKGI